MAEVAGAIAREFPRELKVVTANVYENQKAAVELGIWSVPAFVLFAGGSARGQLGGVRTKEELLGLVRRGAQSAS